MTRKILSSRICAFSFFAFVMITQTSCTNTSEVKSEKSAQQITVYARDSQVKTEYSKSVNSEKEGVDPSDHETARTEWNFGIVPKLGFKIVKEEKIGNQIKIALEITSVKLSLGLPIRILISDKAPADVVAHENGHVEICKRIYANAKKYGSQCSKNVLGKVFSAVNADRKIAISEALRAAGQEIASPYRGLTAAKAKKVSDQYDYLCQHSKTKLPVDKLIEMAFSEIEKQEMQPVKN